MKELRIAQSKARMVPLEHASDNPDVLTIQALVFETLLNWENGHATPGLLQSWQVSDKGRSWLFALRKGARFHDGSPCTTADVMQSLERARDGRDSFGMQSPYARYLKELEFIPQSQDQLLFQSPVPTGDLVDILCEITVRKLSSDGQPIIGTGPYKVEETVNAQYVKLTAADGVADSDYPILHFHEIPKAEERCEALLKGHMDVATGLESVQQTVVNTGLKWWESANTLSVTCFLNGFEEPFNQPEARLAINLAIDVPAIIEQVWNGLAQPATTVVSPHHFGFPPDLSALGYDPARAKKLFESCSMPERLVLRTPLHTPDRAPDVSRLIQEQLMEIGIGVNIETGEDRPQYAQDVGAKKIGHMAIFDSSPCSTYRVLQEKISSTANGMWWQGVADEHADELIDAAHRTVAPKDRARAYSRCLSWLNESPHWLYLYHPTKLHARQAEVTGVSVNHAGLLKVAA